MDRSGANLEHLTALHVEDLFDISWSPDGKSLMFPVDRPMEQGPGEAVPYQICVVDVGSKKVARVSRGRESHSPCWSPDGRRIVYAEIDSTQNPFTTDLVSV